MQLIAESLTISYLNLLYNLKIGSVQFFTVFLPLLSIKRSWKIWFYNFLLFFDAYYKSDIEKIYVRPGKKLSQPVSIFRFNSSEQAG